MDQTQNIPVEAQLETTQEDGKQAVCTLRLFGRKVASGTDSDPSTAKSIALDNFCRALLALTEAQR